MDLCRRMMKNETKILKIRSSGGCFNTIIAMRKAIPQEIEASETVLEVKKTSSQVKITIPNIMLKAGILNDKPIKTPKVVATPFPPLKFKNTVQIWPKIQLNPISSLNKITGPKSGVFNRT